MQTFKLENAVPYGQLCPASGEDLGANLRKAAVALETQRRGVETASVAHWGGDVAQLAYLAADAFDWASRVSIGHNRSARYDEEAERLRQYAAKLEAEAKTARDEYESARLLAAFDDGYAGRDIKHHGFDSREAALLGQLFAKERREMPKRLNKVYAQRPLGRDSVRDHLVDDLGQKFIVDYPDGKIAEAIVTQIG